MTTISSVSAQPGAGGALPESPRSVPPAAGFGAVVRAIARKECREFAAIVGLMAVAYGVVLVALLISERDILNMRPGFISNYWTALPDSFLMGTALMGPIAALILGFAQFFLESRPDRLGFLAHRPATRSAQFSAKLMTGLALYLAALGIPLLVTLWWVSDPRHVPLPFRWSMGLAPLADILSGIPYYFAGVLVAQRTDAKWLGSRLLPIAAPVIASILEVVAPTFAWALLFITLASVLMWYSARSYYLAVGQYPRVSGPGKAATGVVVALGMMTAGAAGLGLLAAMMPRDRSAYYAMERWPGFLKDGTPVVLEQSYGGPIVVKDLAGKTIQEVPADVRYTAADTVKQPDFLYNLDDAYIRQVFHGSNSYFSEGVAGPDGVRWYRSMASTGGDYLVGYDLHARRLVGAIGSKGFEEGVAVPKARFTAPLLISENVMSGAQPWTDPPEVRRLLSAGDSVYTVSGARTLETIFATPNHEKIIGLGRLALPRDPDAVAAIDAVPIILTEDALMILSREASPKILVRHDLPHSREYWISILPLWSNGKFILQVTPKSSGMNGPATLVTYKIDGSLDHTQVRPAIEGSTYVRSGSLVEDWIGPMVAPPALMAAGGALSYLFSPQHEFPPEAGRYVGLPTGVSVLIAAAIFWLARRRQMGRGVWLWTVLGLFLGPAGLLLLLALRGLPLTAACGGCGKRRRVDQLECPHCGAGISGPAKNGTEIFA